MLAAWLTLVMTRFADPDRLQTTNEVLNAFAGVQRHGGVSLHEAIVLDYYGTDEDRDTARKLDNDESWHEVPDADIEAGYSVLNFLDPIGFQYYLPAYMIHAIKNYDHESDRGSASIDATISSLILPDTSELRDYMMRRYQRLTEPQAKAVRRFLMYMEKSGEGFSHDAREALNRYWDRFE